MKCALTKSQSTVSSKWLGNLIFGASTVVIASSILMVAVVGGVLLAGTMLVRACIGTQSSVSGQVPPISLKRTAWERRDDRWG